MAKPKKTWREKLADAKDLPKTIKLEKAAAARWGGTTMVVPAPLEVDALMRQAPAGKLVTIAEIRAALAAGHGVEAACPITSGIFAWMAAHAAEEGAAEGETDVTPYWRTLKSGGELNPKYPGGLAGQRLKLVAEGHTVVVRGKRSFVAGYAEKLAKIKLPKRRAKSEPRG